MYWNFYESADYIKFYQNKVFGSSNQNTIDTLNYLNNAPSGSWHPLILEALKDSFLVSLERQTAAYKEKNSNTLSK